MKTITLTGIMFLLLISFASAELIDEYSITNRDGESQLRNGNGAVQCIQLSKPSIIYNVSLSLRKNDIPTGFMNVTIWDTTGTYGSTMKPTGSPIAYSSNLDISTLATTHGLYNFTFSPPVDVRNKQYVCIGTNISSTGWGGTYYVGFGYDSSSPTHSGNGATYSSGTWTAQTWDGIFAINGVTSAKYSLNIKNSIIRIKNMILKI